MIPMIDIEGFEMPVDPQNKPLFCATLDVATDYTKKDLPPKEVQIYIKIPEYCEGIAWPDFYAENKEMIEFEYESLGTLTVSLPQMFDEFLADYDYAWDDETQAEFMRDTLQQFIKRLDVKIAEIKEKS